MFQKNVWCYGVVDVRDGYGLVRHGIIVDLVEDGGDLLVDFDYPGHHADRVPLSICVAFQQKFKKGPYVDKPAIGQQVQILHQRSPDQPWSWYPGEICLQIADSSRLNPHSLVRCVIDGETIFEFVDANRIQVATEYCLTNKSLRGSRSARFHDEFPRQNIHFRKHRVKTNFYPGIRYLAETPGFRETWNKLTSTMFVRAEVLPDLQLFMHYVTASKHKHELTADDCLKVLLKLDSLLGYHKRKREKRVRDYDQKDEEEKRQRMKLANPGEILPQTQAGDFENDTAALSHLPPELLTETLDYLSAERRTRCRRVCRNWDTIITCSSSVRIEINAASPRMRTALAWALYKTVCTTTTVRVLTVFQLDRLIYPPANNIVPLVATMLAVMNATVRVIVLAHMSANYRDVLPAPPARNLLPSWSWRALCRKLILAEVFLVISEKCSEGDVLTSLQEFRHVKDILWLKNELPKGFVGEFNMRSTVLRLRRSVMNMTKTSC
ncbi:uncharacterized protein LOC129595422 [Paramacrobiotus metropolitanus]|uniref:uncharacterized protein LOC129595422 n=1 Tax=Paramacrobiotus metropolitanus TaxID=2943436 RepID=UPI002445E21C|nr:uncharacterized protein LOC129595422 [Paramacrobiotus metropolitanus]